MKKSKIGLAIAVAMVLGATGFGASASEQVVLDAAIYDPAEMPAMGTVPNRFMVKFRSPTGRAINDRVKAASLSSAVSRAGLAKALRGTTTSSARPAVNAAVERPLAVQDWHAVRTSRHLTAVEAENFLRELQADPNVEVAEPEYLFQHMGMEVPMAPPNDLQYGDYQWNFQDGPGGVRAEQGWEISTGEGVVVAVIDTGIVENHWDLEANVIPGYDMISWFEISRREADGRVPGGWDIGSWVEQNYCQINLGTPPHQAQNSSWHGSHVAGTVAQETNNVSALAGLAHGAQVMPIRALGSCGGLGGDIADGILWAAGLPVEGLPLNENPAQVINMSLGSSAPAACPQFYQDAINQANAAGAIIVVAAGNDDDNAGLYTMSSCDGVISVGATRYDGGRSGYSSWGPAVDLSAPGGDFSFGSGNERAIWQVRNRGTQGPITEGTINDMWQLSGFQGTSMSSPHVAAAVAMVQSALAEADRDLLDWEQMRDLLKQTARPFPVAPPAGKPMGAGILDVGALLTKALEEPCDPEVEECGIQALTLVNKVPATGLAGGELLYALEVPEGVTGVLNITSNGGSGNVSMYVSRDEEPSAESSHWRSTRPGNTETVRMSNPVAGTYYIKLTGSYSGLTLQGRFEAPEVEEEPGPGGNQLQNGVPVTGISGAEDSEQFWTFEVPAGNTNFRVEISGGTGDADLYLRYGAPPTQDDYDCAPFAWGNNEACAAVAGVPAGTWHVMIHGWEAFSGVTLVGSYDE